MMKYDTKIRSINYLQISFLYCYTSHTIQYSNTIIIYFYSKNCYFDTMQYVSNKSYAISYIFNTIKNMFDKL